MISFSDLRRLWMLNSPRLTLLGGGNLPKVVVLSYHPFHLLILRDCICISHVFCSVRFNTMVLQLLTSQLVVYAHSPARPPEPRRSCLLLFLRRGSSLSVSHHKLFKLFKLFHCLSTSAVRRSTSGSEYPPLDFQLQAHFDRSCLNQ